MNILNEYYVLSNGVKIPKIGFGTWQIPNGNDAYNAVRSALKVGYNHIDTAYVYGNEESVGKAIKDSGVKRESLFVTSKLPAYVKEYEKVDQFFSETMKNLGLEYLDLYLIHAPWPWEEIGKDCKEGNAAVWKAIVELYEAGKIKSIGVSNFSPADIKYIVDQTGFVPHVNQIAYFIGKNQKETYDYCEKENIFIEAYSPLGIGFALKNPIVIEMAQKYNVTPAQLCIRYCLDMNTAPLPKSVHENRMVENVQLDFKISKEDLKILNSIEDDRRE